MSFHLASSFKFALDWGIPHHMLAFSPATLCLLQGHPCADIFWEAAIVGCVRCSTADPLDSICALSLCSQAGGLLRKCLLPHSAGIPPQHLTWHLTLLCLWTALQEMAERMLWYIWINLSVSQSKQSPWLDVFYPLGDQGGQALKQALLTAPEMWGGTLGYASSSHTAQHHFREPVMGHLLSIVVPDFLFSSRKWNSQTSSTTGSASVTAGHMATCSQLWWAFSQLLKCHLCPGWFGIE